MTLERAATPEEAEEIRQATHEILDMCKDLFDSGASPAIILNGLAGAFWTIVMMFSNHSNVFANIDSCNKVLKNGEMAAKEQAATMVLENTPGCGQVGNA